MNPDELIESLELLERCVSVSSSEKHKITIIENIKPSSFVWVIDSTIEFIKQLSDERKDEK